MSNLVIEIQAPTIVAAIEKLAGVLATKAVTVNQTIPQGSAPSQPSPMPRPSLPQPVPMAPGAQQPQYPQYPTPPQQYRPAAPVNPTPTAPIQTPAVPPMNSANVVPQPTAPIQQAPVAAAPTYQIDDLARAAAQLMDAGKQQDLIALLGQFGVQTLGQLPSEQFGAFATALRQMGAKV